MRLLTFIATQKDMLLTQISLRREELDRIAAQAAIQEQLIEGTYAKLKVFDEFESACATAMQSHGVNMKSVIPFSCFDVPVSIGSYL